MRARNSVTSQEAGAARWSNRDSTGEEVFVRDMMEQRAGTHVQGHV